MKNGRKTRLAAANASKVAIANAHALGKITVTVNPIVKKHAGINLKDAI